LVVYQGRVAQPQPGVAQVPEDPTEDETGEEQDDAEQGAADVHLLGRQGQPPDQPDGHQDDPAADEAQAQPGGRAPSPGGGPGGDRGAAATLGRGGGAGGAGAAASL